MIRVPAPAFDPGEALLRCARGERPFLLDGSSDADGLGRFSFAGCDPDDGVTWSLGDAGDPLALLAAAQQRWTSGPVDDKPWPVAVGYLAYDLGERCLARKLSSVDDLGLPALDFARYPAVWRFDRAAGRAEVLALDGRSAEKLLGRLARAPLPAATPRIGTSRWEISPDEYRARVGRVIEYLRAGDAYQVNLSHRVVTPVDEAGVLQVYLRLRRSAPAPLGGFLSLPGGALLSNTPELFLRVARDAERSGTGWRAETRPIKGTRARSESQEGDARLADELRGSSKDAAEHLMIVDLERNDLGRVAELGSVRVEGFRRNVMLPTVHHLVSTVSATLRPEVGLRALLEATFPGGSITGAPKLRAMEIIDELERVRRGPYCGALGWLGPGLRLDLALAIRTAVWRAGEMILGVGGGIVADSRADDELEETRVKAQAFLRVLA